MTAVVPQQIILYPLPLLRKILYEPEQVYLAQHDIKRTWCLNPRGISEGGASTALRDMVVLPMGTASRYE